MNFAKLIAAGSGEYDLLTLMQDLIRADLAKDKRKCIVAPGRRNKSSNSKMGPKPKSSYSTCENKANIRFRSWQALVRISGTRKYLGSYRSEAEALEVARQAYEAQQEKQSG